MSSLTKNGLSYQQQLERPEWDSCRNNILKRDEHRCCMCGRGPSLKIQFDSLSYYIGIDCSKSEVDCSTANISRSIKLVDFARTWNKHSLKYGNVPNTNLMGMLSIEGHFLYVTGDKVIKDLNSFNNAYVTKVLCGDGYEANVIFFNKSDLENNKIPRVYIQNTPLTLQVHHKQYITGLYAWEYNENDLVTLCSECHLKVHKYLPTKVYAKVGDILRVMNYTPCHRCNGTGYFPQYRYVENGICFRCHGERFEELIPRNQYEPVDL